ncbi:hypothetical protein [Nocardioides sp. TF02-7]|uniref:hypothetical protein n=1 Tax=Nocardioides sp. TF02-7 TaxID=2917724 RepID=UPI001F06647A|nr:hypothetical protein [Nocardioides sp. TF02-7]UMG93182.1 hypothetical protein MF408_02440 [Nocardioides sp. TF02-7]
MLGGAQRAGVVRVSAADAEGEPLLEQERFEIGADHGVAVDLPDEAVLVTVDARNTPVSATVELTGGRTGTLRLRQPEVYAEVPAVRPGAGQSSG